MSKELISTKEIMKELLSIVDLLRISSLDALELSKEHLQQKIVKARG